VNRRNFLEAMLCGLGAAVAVRKFPFSVYSFPKEIKVLNATRVPDYILQLWKQRLESIKRFGTEVYAEWWMHPKQLAVLKEIGFGYPQIEIKKVGEGPFPYSMPDFYPPSTLFGIPIRESPFFPPDAKPVLMERFSSRLSVPDVPDLYPLRPERPRNPFPHPSRLKRT
jgi:hypothetical protein